MRKIIEENTNGIVIVDKKGVVRYVNSIAEDFFGRYKNEFIGEDFGYPTRPGIQEIAIIRKLG